MTIGPLVAVVDGDKGEKPEIGATAAKKATTCTDNLIFF